MWIDVVLGILVVFCGLMGVLQGVVIQLFRLGGVVLIVLYARWLAEDVGQLVAGQFDLNPLLAYYLALIVGGIIVYAFCALVGRGVHRMIHQGSETAHEVNRFLGGVLGLANGLAIAFLVAAVLDMVPADAVDRWPGASTQLKQSRAVPVVHSVNPLPDLHFLVYANDYKRLLKDEEAQKIFQKHDRFAELQANVHWQQAVRDREELEKLIKEDRWAELLVHKRVVALLFDPEVRKILNDLNPELAIEEARRIREKDQVKKP